MNVAVIIPTKNEETGIATVIKKIPKGYRTVIIDKSTDKTAKIAAKLGVRVIKQRNDGKGNAMREAAASVKSDIIVFIDGDDSYPPEKIKDLVTQIKSGDYDLVYGVRKLKPYSMSLTHKFGNWIFAGLATVLYKKTSDLLTGMFAIKRENFLKLNLTSKGFEIETEIFIKAVKKGLKIKEIPVVYTQRLGKNKLNAVVDGIKIISTLFKYKFSD
jgi:glycosyltransferase involved in cell wall biosynthesis